MASSITGWFRRRRAVKRRFNPYVAGAPVFDRQLFVGRDALARRALELVSSRSLRLSGERRIGKTSFLHHLHGAIAADAEARSSWPVFVDLEAINGTGLFRAVMDEAIDAVGPAASTRATLCAPGGRKGYGADEFGHDLDRLLAALRARTPRPVRLVLLVDEADALLHDAEGVGDDWLAPLLAAFPRELRVVLAGARASAIGRDDATFADLELPPLTREAARELVERPVAGVYRFEPPAVDEVLERSALRPYAIQRLCLHAVNRMLDDSRATVRVADIGAAPDGGHAESRRAAAFQRDEQRAN